MDLRTSTIIDLQLVQSNEVGGSNNMEKEGLRRSLDLLRAHSVNFDSIVTDRPPHIQKYLQEANITQYYDVWHTEKGLLSENNCLLSIREDPQKQENSERALTIRPHHSRHSVAEFCALRQKNVIFSFLGMLCRLYLAALHFNENAGHSQATTAAGEPLFKVVFPKYRKGQCSAKPVKVEPTFKYVENLLELIFENVFVDLTPNIDDILKISIPEDLTSQFDKPDKQEVMCLGLIKGRSEPYIWSLSIRELCPYLLHTQEVSTTLILQPKMPQHKLTKLLYAKNL